MTYTKAPWHICTTGHGLRLIRDENGYCVAEAVKPANSGAAYIDADANARLIAAAPDMLAALEAVLPDLWDGLEFATDQNANEAWLADALHRLDVARAAIAKAKGEA
jgi:hypothetical protein